MKKQMMSSKTILALLYATLLSSGALLLSACSTTPDESYKKSQMAKPLDYPPDLVVPVTNDRFSLPPPDAAPISTPILFPERAPRKPANKGGGHAH